MQARFCRSRYFDATKTYKTKQILQQTYCNKNCVTMTETAIILTAPVIL